MQTAKAASTVARIAERIIALWHSKVFTFWSHRLENRLIDESIENKILMRLCCNGVVILTKAGQSWASEKGTLASFARRRPHAAAPTKRPFISCLTRCTVPVPTPHWRAILRMPLPPRSCTWMRFGCFYLWGAQVPTWEKYICLARAYHRIVERLGGSRSFIA